MRRVLRLREARPFYSLRKELKQTVSNDLLPNTLEFNILCATRENAFVKNSLVTVCLNCLKYFNISSIKTHFKCIYFLSRNSLIFALLLDSHLNRISIPLGYAIYFGDDIITKRQNNSFLFVLYLAK